MNAEELKSLLEKREFESIEKGYLDKTALIKLKDGSLVTVDAKTETCSLRIESKIGKELAMELVIEAYDKLRSEQDIALPKTTGAIVEMKAELQTLKK